MDDSLEYCPVAKKRNWAESTKMFNSVTVTDDGGESIPAD